MNLYPYTALQISAATELFKVRLHPVGNETLTEFSVSEASRIDDFELLKHRDALPPQFDIIGSMLF